MGLQSERPRRKLFRRERIRKLFFPLVLLVFAAALVILYRQFFGGRPGITKGPVLLGVSQTEAAVMWETNVEGQGEIHYQAVDNDQASYVVRVAGQPVRHAYGPWWWPWRKKGPCVHKMRLDELKPGVTYQYEVRGPNVQSEVYEFRTVPADTNEVRFVVYGDSRSNPKEHRRIVEQIIKCRPDFVVNTGDLVANGGKYKLWGPEFFEPLHGLAESVPVYTIRGNHEIDHTGMDAYGKLLIPPGQESSYSFEYGPVRYVCLDQYEWAFGEPNEQVQLNWVAEELGKSKKRWNFVSYHEPSLSFGKQPLGWGYPDAVPRLSEARADFVITGHVHHYERFLPIAPPEDVNGSYVTYITSAGGGAPLHDVREHEFHAAKVKQHHFCLF